MSTNTFTVIEMAPGSAATSEDEIVPHKLPANMVRIFIGRDVSIQMALNALEQAKAKIVSGDRIAIMPRATNSRPN
jgi:hypothetical protein